MTGVGEYLKELRKKIGPAFCFERKGQRWNRENPIEYKVWLVGNASIDSPTAKRSIPERLNPVLKGKLDRITKTDLDCWRELIHNHILNSRPGGTDAREFLRNADSQRLTRHC